MSKTSPEHVSQGNVLDDLGFESAEAQALKMKADAISAIHKIAKTRKLTQKALSKLLDQPQPRISDLMNGKISKVSLEKLLEYLALLGAKTSLDIRYRKAA